MSNQPFGRLTPLSTVVYDGGGRVIGGRLVVYEGIREIWPEGTPARLVGGNAPYFCVTLGAKVPAPAPPVAVAGYVPANAVPVAPSWPHNPLA